MNAKTRKELEALPGMLIVVATLASLLVFSLGISGRIGKPRAHENVAAWSPLPAAWNNCFPQR